jgi:RNA polymerase sigma-70 factor (ECF subfamily)
MDEQDLIRRAAAGDRDAFEALVERQRERVFWIACHVVGDRDMARDVVQEVCLRLYRSLGRFRAGGRLAPWLYRMTLNLAIDALRRDRARRETVSLDDPGGRPAGASAGERPGLPASGVAAARESPAGESVRRREVRRIFAELSALLPPKQRFAFILREIEGLSTAEVAEVLKTRESTVRNHILQARRTLQEELRRRYPEYCRPPSRRD